MTIQACFPSANLISYERSLLKKMGRSTDTAERLLCPWKKKYWSSECFSDETDLKKY